MKKSLMMFCCAILLVCATAVAGMAQSGTEVLRGRVIGPDKQPIRGASITIVGLQSKLERTTTTNGNGVYTALFTQPEGQYVIRVRAVGFAPLLRRVINNGEGDLLITDFTMSRASAVTTLDAVTVTGSKSGDTSSIGSDEIALLMQGALFSLDPADLTTFMSNIPGVIYTPGENGEPGSFSVLGAGLDENTVQVDGVGSNSARLPSGAVESMSLATTSFDPSRGGFSGGMMSIRTRAGTNIHQANINGTLTDPRLSWRDAAYPQPPSATQAFSMHANGPVVKNKMFYSMAYSLTRNTTELQSLLNLKSALWRQYGLIRDTVNAVTDALRTLGVPLTTSQMPNQQQRLSHSLFGRVDMNPTATTAMTLNMMGNIDQSDGNGVSAMAYPAMGAQSSGSNIMTSLTASTTKGNIVNLFSSAVKRRVDSRGPYLSLPNGSVLIPSQFGDDRLGLTSVRFGGGSSSRTQSRDLEWETQNEISLLTADSRHRVKLAGSLKLTSNESQTDGNIYGIFNYQTLDDLRANRPSSYTRQLSSRNRTATAVTGSVSLGDRWRATDSWSFEYGVRLDLARSGTRPGYNPVVDTAFGRRTDEFPSDVGISPRFGFSWRQGGASVAGPSINMLGDGGALPTDLGLGAVSQVYVSGGIGAFRNVISPSMIASLIDQTGLPNTVRQLRCVGDATPIPDWEAYAANVSSIPDHCLDGSAPVEFSSSAPSVLLYDPTFHAPLSWRANVNVGGIAWKGWRFGVNTTISLGFHGSSTVDLNLRRDPAFMLSGEGNRPVYVPASAIVEATGAIAPGASRISDQFGTVNNTLSDLRTFASTVSFSFVRSRPFFDHIPIMASYTWSRNRAQYRGTAAGFDPWTKEWAAGGMPTHAINVNSYFNIKWFTVMARLTVTSGSRYTPIVMGDINGDGRSGDRAFVFNPSASTDAVLAEQMQSLLDGMPSLARKCLEQNMGRVAGYNSCSTGWQLIPNINFGIIDPTRRMNVSDRLRFSLVTQNAFSAVARIFGMSQSVLGRSEMLSPDATLLYVDGFDPAEQRFRYRVNQQFGDIKRSVQANRNMLPPFQLGLRGDLSLGGPPRRSFAQNMGLVPANKDDPLLRHDQVMQRLQQLAANPLTQILRMQDSLLLTEDQVKTLTQLNSGLSQQLEQVMDPIADYIVSEGRKTDDRELMRRIGKARTQAQTTMLSAVTRAHAVLSEEQRGKLPRYVRAILAGQRNDAPRQPRMDMPSGSRRRR